ncbi:hypothetical protein BEWA_046170 [Theileria equi strain WA]|uniref:Uncharacterized protein n=1 Tax=Theileria equi strain WA TaxID=1537102 RepID=L1LAF4_THEEQ|nr:hypothetical protein BEWA_046170 [Theileria equi strain WA]EKX72153.1 hypothetical protein BEWA_046170 [Theileria equi strain WA]|eukprot:XP_004831605.1 hypothetical protein BEWA_046170 [Theileria equi strain WA]
MVGITTTDTGNRTKYYKNSDGNKWVEKHDLSTNGELIEKKLDDLNCYSNDAVTVKLTKDAYGTGKLHCCDGHKNHSKVSVEPVSVNHPHSRHHLGSENLTVKKYSILGTTLAAIKHDSSSEDKKNRIKRIKIPGLKASGNDPVDIYTVYSGNSKNPELIYVKGGDPSVDRKWFKKGGNGDENWTKAPELSGIIPENITECANWNSLVGELRDSNSDLQDCSQEKLRKQKLQTQRSEEVAPGTTTLPTAPEVTEIQHLSDPFSLTVATQPYLEAPPAHQPRGNDSSWIEHTVFGCLASWSNGVLLHCG